MQVPYSSPSDQPSSPSRPVNFADKSTKKGFEKMPLPVKDTFSKDLLAISVGHPPYSDTCSVAKTVGRGAIELKINGANAFRCVYVEKIWDAIFILHTFKKETNGVAHHHMDTAKKRYTLVTDETVDPVPFEILPLDPNQPKNI